MSEEPERNQRESLDQPKKGGKPVTLTIGLAQTGAFNDPHRLRLTFHYQIATEALESRPTHTNTLHSTCTGRDFCLFECNLATDLELISLLISAHLLLRT